MTKTKQDKSEHRSIVRVGSASSLTKGGQQDIAPDTLTGRFPVAVSLQAD